MHAPFAILLLAVVAFVAGCGDHDHDHDDAHAHHDGERHALETLSYTHHTDTSELFIEMEPLVVGQTSRAAAHVTMHGNGRPLSGGRVELQLLDGETVIESAIAKQPARPGIFVPALTPRSPGEYRLVARVEAPGLSTTHPLGAVTVHASLEKAEQAAHAQEPGTQGIYLSKEQQWRSDFITANVQMRTLAASVRAPGVLRADTAREAHVVAPTGGWVVAGKTEFLHPGATVTEGDTLLRIVPRLGEQTDVAALETAVARTRAADTLARAELERVLDLVEQGVLPRRRAESARAAFETATAELEAAERRLAQYQGTADRNTKGVAVPAPVSGEIAQVFVHPGAVVEAGTRLVHILDSRVLWLEAQVAEADASRVRAPAGAWFETGSGSRYAVTPTQGAQLVSFAASVDPVRRTVPVIFSFPPPDTRLRVGQYVEAHVYIGERAEGLAAPRSAVIDDTGRSVVFVQLDGEHFERRAVRTGIAEGDWILVTEGLAADERIVTEGAYLVHLAASAPAEIGHGHAH
jgi:RND family efflux transporter MFP subunit